jgi:hypothetical protein
MLSKSKFDESKLKKRIRKGIPDAMRATVWKKVCQQDSVAGRLDFTRLTQITEVPYRRDIEVDIPRTFPNHEYLRSDSGKESMFEILKAISLQFPEMGYC